MSVTAITPAPAPSNQGLGLLRQARRTVRITSRIRTSVVTDSTNQAV